MEHPLATVLDPFTNEMLDLSLELMGEAQSNEVQHLIPLTANLLDFAQMWDLQAEAERLRPHAQAVAAALSHTLSVAQED